MRMCVGDLTGNDTVSHQCALLKLPSLPVGEDAEIP